MMEKKIGILDKEFSQEIHWLATEYASLFLGGLEGIGKREQNRLNEIEIKIREMNINWKDWTELCVTNLKFLEDKPWR